MTSVSSVRFGNSHSPALVFGSFFDLTMVSGCQMQAVAGIRTDYGNRAFLWLDMNLNIYVAGPFSVDATGESWDE